MMMMRRRSNSKRVGLVLNLSQRINGCSNPTAVAPPTTIPITNGVVPITVTRHLFSTNTTTTDNYHIIINKFFSPHPLVAAAAASSSSSVYNNNYYYFSRRNYSTQLVPPQDEEEVEPIEEWEEEDEAAEPQIGDGGRGGGVVLQGCDWGERVLSIAREVLLSFGGEMELFAFKASPSGYIYVRLDKLSSQYGCPDMEELESFSSHYKKRLEEVGAEGEIPEDFGLQVSSPGLDRLLKVPDDLQRFKDLPMTVSYVADAEGRSQEKSGVFFLESDETESRSCVWRLADVKENRDPSAKGKPLNRKQKDWRLKLPYAMLKNITLYVDY